MFRFRWIKEDNIYVHFCASMVAGLVAAAVTSPVDVVKTRVMNQPVIGGRPTLYLSTVDCVRKTVKAEGLLSLYKGFVPNWIRIGPHTIITFLVYEQLRLLFGLKPF